MYMYIHSLYFYMLLRTCIIIINIFLPVCMIDRENISPHPLVWLLLNQK